MPIIRLDSICKSYGNKIILDKFSLDINKGDLMAITGSSGSGKSTILNIIGLLEEFDSGTLLIDNAENIRINSKKSNEILRNKINYLFQNFALVDEKSVRFNLELALKYTCKGKKEKAKRIADALSFVGLAGYEDRYIYELSGGEQQRVAIARVILKPSEIILADEPTGSLDEQNREIVMSLLKELNNQGKTVIIVTHDKYVANECKRIINL